MRAMRTIVWWIRETGREEGDPRGEQKLAIDGIPRHACQVDMLRPHPHLRARYITRAMNRVNIHGIEVHLLLPIHIPIHLAQQLATYRPPQEYAMLPLLDLHLDIDTPHLPPLTAPPHHLLSATTSAERPLYLQLPAPVRVCAILVPHLLPHLLPDISHHLARLAVLLSFLIDRLILALKLRPNESDVTYLTATRVLRFLAGP
jgi:hypothetical protein